MKGFCAAPAVNLTGNTIIDGECGDATACLDAFPFNDYFDDLDMTESEGIAKILEWQMFGPNYAGTTITAVPAEGVPVVDDGTSLTTGNIL